MAQTDAELLTLWRDGDPRAGERLVERHFIAVYGYFARRIGDDGAQELAQATFEALTRRRERFEIRSSIRALLLGIARNKLLQYHQQRQRDRSLPLPADPTLVSASQAIEHAQDLRLLLRALRSLPTADQQVLELSYWEHLSAPEVGEVLGLAPSSVRSRLLRARDRLRQAVSEMATDPAAMQTTLDNLDRWAADVRDDLETP